MFLYFSLDFQIVAPGNKMRSSVNISPSTAFKFLQDFKEFGHFSKTVPNGGKREQMLMGESVCLASRTWTADSWWTINIT